jgi:hypothetical protein
MTPLLGIDHQNNLQLDFNRLVIAWCKLNNCPRRCVRLRVVVVEKPDNEHEVEICGV